MSDDKTMTFYEDRDIKARDGEKVRLVIDGEVMSGEFVYRGTNLETGTSTFDIKIAAHD